MEAAEKVFYNERKGQVAGERRSAFFYHQVDSPTLTILPLWVYQGERFFRCVVAVKQLGESVYLW